MFSITILSLAWCFYLHRILHWDEEIWRTEKMLWEECFNSMLWFLLILTIWFRSDGSLAPKFFSDYLTLRSFNYQRTDKHYPRNVSCTLNLIFTFKGFILFSNGSMVSSKNYKKTTQPIWTRWAITGSGEPLVYLILFQ
jgi:hypothetical protein